MNHGDAIRQYELRVRQVHGRQLTRVWYVALEHGAEQEEWGKRRVETAPFGVELMLDSGESFSVRWDREFVQNHIGVFHAPMSRLFSLHNLAVVEVSTLPEWRAVVGRQITGSDVHWIADAESLVRYTPDMIELQFDGGQRVYFGLYAYDAQRDALEPHHDDVSVVLGEDAARRYRVGPYRRHADFRRG